MIFCSIIQASEFCRKCVWLFWTTLKWWVNGQPSMFWNVSETLILDQISELFFLFIIIISSYVSWNCLRISINYMKHRYFVLGLPTGSTPMKMYENLVKYHKAGKISFQYVKTFNMDEYASKLYEPFVSNNTFFWHNLDYFLKICHENIQKAIIISCGIIF